MCGNYHFKLKTLIDPDDALTEHIVSKDINSTRNKVDAPYLIEPVTLF